jgi:hypothetical protein
MDERKTSKIHEIKETASDAVEIIRQIGTPSVRESLTKVKETATIINEMMQGLKTPEMVRNIENFRLISENMNEATTKMQDTMHQLKETGVIDESTQLIKSAKGKINSFGNGVEGSINGQDLYEMSTATKEMMVSIKDLMMELKVTVSSSTKSGTIRNVKESINEVSEMYQTAITHAN